MFGGDLGERVQFLCFSSSFFIFMNYTEYLLVLSAYLFTYKYYLFGVFVCFCFEVGVYVFLFFYLSAWVMNCCWVVEFGFV